VVIMVGARSMISSRQGLVRAGSQGRPRALADRHGCTRRADKPDIGSVDAFRRALLNANRSAYSDSASGIYLFDDTLCKAGVADQVAGRAASEGTAGQASRWQAVVARGEAEIGFSAGQRTDTRARVTFVGAIPAELQQDTFFSAALGNAVRQPEAAGALLRFLASSEAAPAISKAGLAPLSGGSQGCGTDRFAAPPTRGKCTMPIALLDDGRKLEVRGFIAYAPWPVPDLGSRGVKSARLGALVTCFNEPSLTANTQTAPPCGTSGYWPGKIRSCAVCIFAGSTPQPDCTAIYCCAVDLERYWHRGNARAVGNSHSTLPVLASNARNMQVVVPPANSKPPPVAEDRTQLNDGMLVVPYLLPVSRFRPAARRCVGAATIFSTFSQHPGSARLARISGFAGELVCKGLSLAGM